MRRPNGPRPGAGDLRPERGQNTGHINASSGTFNDLLYAINRGLAALAVSDAVSTQLNWTPGLPATHRAFEVADVMVRLIDEVLGAKSPRGQAERPSRERLMPEGPGLSLGEHPVASVALALAARAALQAAGTPTAVVSMPCWELFEQQDSTYRASLLGATGGVRVGCKAALRFGWERWRGERGGFVGMSGFGASGAAEVLYRHFGITPDAIVAEARRLLAHQPEQAMA
jgi:hypothetical protein